MLITPLGHTEFLVDIANNEGENIRILVDSWLTDYAVGDMMERTVKVKLDPEKIKTIDAIYISHAHCDHFDPYTLVEIFNSCHVDEGDILPKSEQDFSSSITGADGLCRNDRNKKPILILPFTLRYLEPLIAEYLPSATVKWLANHEKYLLRGVEISGHMWSHPDITNEDDVMMLSIATRREFLFAEIDSVPDMENIDVMRALSRLFSEREYDTRAYIASRNVLEASIPALDLSPSKRSSYRANYIAREKEKMEFAYERYDYDEYIDFPRIYDLPGYVRGFIGQGIAYPNVLSDELFSYQIFPLEEIASLESDIAKNHGYDYAQKALLPGRQYRLEDGNIETGRKECPIGELDNRRKEVGDRDSLVSSPLDKGGKGDFVSERLYASGPLFPRDFSLHELEEAKQKILEMLHSRFLPYWSASPVASLRDALIKNDGVYRIEFSVPVIAKNEAIQDNKNDFIINAGLLHLPSQGQARTSQGPEQKIIFEYSTARTGFREVPYIEKMHIDEDYWLLDVLDFLEGRQEMYSSFWHRLDPRRAYRLWTCLGANYMNHDLVAKKYCLHFERAKDGLTANDFVEEILKNLTT